jgi:116 kDa U5 small nuclear ribonucleoprotein component
VSFEKEQLEPILKQLGVYLKKEHFKLDTRSMLKLICKSFFGDSRSFVDMVVKHIPNPQDSTCHLVNRCYSGTHNDDTKKKLRTCDPNGPLVIDIVKLYPTPPKLKKDKIDHGYLDTEDNYDANNFSAFGRIISGILDNTSSCLIQILLPNYSLNDPSASSIQPIPKGGISIFCARFGLPVDTLTCGNWVLIESICESIPKYATLSSLPLAVDLLPFKPLHMPYPASFKIALEPLIPSELPKMLLGIRNLNRSYPGLVSIIETSGEHTLSGYGEMYLDSVLKDLREKFSNIEIKVSDPWVNFRETIIETSGVKGKGKSGNGMNEITVICEPVEEGITHDMEKEHFDLFKTFEENERGTANRLD